MDFKDYQSQIKELTSLRNEPDFNELLNNILFGVNNSDKFLIKMELNRLATPCLRIIDLRDKVTEVCQVYQQGTLVHYLTADTIKILQDNINLFGIYSIGVFEAVHSHIAQQKEISTKKTVIDDTPKQDQCEFLHLSQKNKRAAPRMFFVSTVEISLSDGTRIEAHTSNISATGVKIKLNRDIQILNDSYLQITFRGMQLEYQETVLADKINYQLVKQTHEGDSHYLYLMYADSAVQFITFLRNFIKNNQYKYKIDVHYYYQLAKISALNSIYLAQMNTLPIYLDSRLSSPFLLTLKNRANQQILNEWSCNGINQLPVLFDELRLAQLIAQLREKTATTVYCFTHTAKGKNYFLSASEEELLEKGLKNIFINYGCNKKSWRVYHLTLNSYQYQQSHSYDITEPVPPEFKQITHIATLQPLYSPSFSITPIIDKKSLNKINQFVHRDQNESEISVFTLFSDEQRKESRYLYKSKLSLHSQESNYTGELVDFSFSGLRIKLDQITSFAPSTVLTVNLLELQKISAKFSLSQLHYKVVRSGPNNTLHLQVCDTKTLDICNHFFSLLVQSNPNYFTCLPLKTAKQPTRSHLLEIAQDAFIDCIFFLGKEAGRPKIRFAAIDKVNHPLQKLFSMNSDSKSELNYYPLINNHLYERLIAQPFKNSETEGLFKEAIIYVEASKNKNNRWLINSFLDSDFKSEKEKTDFIIQADTQGKFYALHYRLSAITPVDLRGIQTEIRAISRFAIHLTKKLEEELCAINAIIEVTDRTFYTLQALQQRELLG